MKKLRLRGVKWLLSWWESQNLWSWGLGLWEKTQLPGRLVRCRSLEDVRRQWRVGVSLRYSSGQEKGLVSLEWAGRRERTWAHDHQTREVAVGNVVGSRVEWQDELCSGWAAVKDDFFFSVLGFQASSVTFIDWLQLLVSRLHFPTHKVLISCACLIPKYLGRFWVPVRSWEYRCLWGYAWTQGLMSARQVWVCRYLTATVPRTQSDIAARAFHVRILSLTLEGAR